MGGTAGEEIEDRIRRGHQHQNLEILLIFIL